MSDELKNKAVEWFVRLRAPDVTPRDRDRHDAWLVEGAEHRDAYALVEDEWRRLDGLSGWAQTELSRLESALPRRRLWRNPWMLGLGSASVLAIAALFSLRFLLPGSATEHIATARGEQRRVILDDGSRLHLNSASAVDVRFSAREREVRLIEGEGLFDVAHDPGRPFVVQVPGNRVIAVGTLFNVYYVKDKLAVTVLEGKVIVIPNAPQLGRRQESEVLLEPNQQVRINFGHAIEEVKAVDAARLTSWDRGLLIFDNTPLPEVAAEISRYVGGEIRLASGVPDVPVTGTIKIRDMESMLQVLSEVAPITPVRTGPDLTTLVYSPGSGPRD